MYEQQWRSLPLSKIPTPFITIEAEAFRTNFGTNTERPVAPKNLGFGKDAVLARRLHGGNIRNRARAMVFLTTAESNRVHDQASVRPLLSLCFMWWISYKKSN
jgi:hypothetical protein